MSWYDNGMPVINDPDVLGTAELIRRLYEDLGECTGGPLHVILEDGNTEDEHVHDSDYFGLREGYTVETYLCKHRWQPPMGHVYDDELACPEEVADLCRLILASFRRMPEPWRAAAIAWYDGTAWEALERLAGEPLISGPPSVTDEQVDDLIADLRRWISQGEQSGPKACTPIPCPPFTEVPLASPWAEHVRMEQRADTSRVRVTKLDADGQPVGEPVEVSGWAAVGIQADEPDPEHLKPMLKWVEATFSSDDPMLRALVLGDVSLPLQIDMGEVLDQPPAVSIPKIVRVPRGISNEQAHKLLTGMLHDGLLKPSEAGWLYLPEEMTR